MPTTKETGKTGNVTVGPDFLNNRSQTGEQKEKGGCAAAHPPFIYWLFCFLKLPDKIAPEQ
ncbi:MAG TPA: hypothetical protein DDW70_07085 [Rikenellaceae bacterium]|nr:hypothetical protein [Rikenellaceae bacterium]